MKRMFAAAFGLCPGGCVGGLGPAARPQRRSADRAQLQLVRLRRRRRHPARPAARTAAIACASIYNAIYDEQVRTYEIFLQPDGTAGLGIGVLADQGEVDQPPDAQRRRRAEAVAHAARRAHPERRRDPRTDGVVPGERRLRPAARRSAPAGRRFLVDGRLMPQRRVGLSGLSLSDRRFRQREVRRRSCSPWTPCRCRSIRRASSCRPNCAAIPTRRSTT